MRRKRKKTCNNNNTKIDNRVERKWKVWGEGVGGGGGEQIWKKITNMPQIHLSFYSTF